MTRRFPACERNSDGCRAWGGRPLAGFDRRGRPPHSWRLGSALGAKLGREIRRDAERQAKDEGRQFDPDRTVEFHDLLKTTFEPGALLMVAANCDRRTDPPPAVNFSRFAGITVDAERRAAIENEEGETRKEVGEQLGEGADLDPAPLVEHLNVIPYKAPRVLYNLACYYSMAAARRSAADRREDDLAAAAEYLRQGISRMPPLERRGLLERTMVDKDLRELVRARGRAVRKLWKLVPDPPRHISVTL